MKQTKQQLRDGAKARFKIMSFTEWCSRNNILAISHNEVLKADYDSYLFAKKVEAKALGVK